MVEKEVKIDSAKVKGKWILHDKLLVYNPFNLQKDETQTKLLSFDMDGTIIETESGKAHPTNSSDWKLKYNKMNEIIHKESIGKALVIFSNQKGISQGSTDQKGMQGKVEKIVAKLNSDKNFYLPFIVFLSTDSGYYRKPSIGMFEYLKKNYYPNLQEKSCLYVGDAAGRPKKDSQLKDFSDSDYMFTLNAKIDFAIPEKFFLGQNQSFPKKPEFDPFVYEEKELDYNRYKDLCDEKKVMFIFVGSAGSGKSSYYFNYLAQFGIVRVNNDELKSEKNCIKKVNEAISLGKGMAIENMNTQKVKRKLYIDIAKKANYKVICLYFNYPKDLVMHLNNQRKLLESVELDKIISSNNYTSSVSSVIIHTFYKHLEIPELNEGFNEIKEINFEAGGFKSDIHRKTFYMYTSL